MYIAYRTSISTKKILKELLDPDWENNERLDITQSIILSDFRGNVEYFVLGINHRSSYEFVALFLEIEDEDKFSVYPIEKREVFIKNAESYCKAQLSFFLKTLECQNESESKDYLIKNFPSTDDHIRKWEF